ncbi:hypothetical protein [Streptomyces sp. NBC_01317]|uniref:hypothetical protein n=1 Tax=Streptomyces sp. NBC_01317 TaxID=2903822 RepID=UPI003FA39F22
MARGHLSGPAPEFGEAPGGQGGEGVTTGGERRGGGTRQGVGHRVEEVSQQPFRLGQKNSSGQTTSAERNAMRGGRRGGGERTDPLQVLGRQWSGPPRVVPGAGGTRQHPSTGRQLPGEQRRRAPEGAGR